MRDGQAKRMSAWRWSLARIRRRVRQWQGTEPRTRVQIRAHRVQHGGWWICPEVLRPGDLVYSFDLGSDLQLERALIQDYSARVYLFDPHPEVAARAEAEGLLDELQLDAIQVGAENRDADPSLGMQGAGTVRLGSLMKTLGHRRVDLVKLNAAGASAAIRDLVALEVDVRQLLVAFPTASSPEERDGVEELVGVLERYGYRIFYITHDGRRYSFIRTDFGES